MSEVNIENKEIPCNPLLSYYPFQEEGIRFARGRDRVLIADEMGVGKTIQAIGVINDNPEYKKILVVCPASLKYNWENELRLWLYDTNMSIKVCSQNFIPDVDIAIINYDRLHKVANLRDVDFDMIIFDEVHYIKNDKSKRTRAICGFRNSPPLTASKVVGLTGTPVTNHPIDAWTICNYFDPKTFNNKWAFIQRYCAPKMRYGRMDYSGASNLGELSSKMTNFMIRRKKLEVLPQLPSKQYQVIEMNIPVKAHKLINREKSLTEFTEDNSRVIVKFDDTSKIRKELGEMKVNSIITRLEEMMEETDEKIVVFAHHRSVIEKIYESFEGKAVRVYGGMSGISKQESIDAFQTNPNIKLFVGSITSAGIGITLTASSILCFAEMSYVPSEMDQAEDRIHRASQKSNSVNIIYFVYRDSLDANIAHSIVDKKRVINQIVG